MTLIAFQRLSKLGKSFLSGIAAATVINGSAFATPVLDLSSTSDPSHYALFCTVSCEWQQELVAGLTGQLTGITLFGSTTAQLRIAKGKGFVTDSWDIDILSVPINGTMIDLTAYKLFVKAGHTFVIDLSNMQGGTLLGNPSQAPGSLWLKQPGTPYPLINYREAFPDQKIQLNYLTYVDTDASRGHVPEPSVLTLVAVGLLGLGTIRKRKL